jgi:hypothetical protein
MKIINLETGFLAYQKLFKHIQQKTSSIVVWQVSSETGERTVTDTHLNSFSLDSKLLHFELNIKTSLDPDKTAYVYSEEEQFIFKSRIEDIKAGFFSLKVPPEIQLLEATDVKEIHKSLGREISTHYKSKRIPIREVIKPDYLILTSMSHRTSRDKEFLSNEFDFMTLDEEDKAFAEKRESPRARPKADKTVKLSCEEDNAVKTQILFDLSQGGMSFITYDTQLYPVGSRVKIIGFEDFVLDDPLVAEVMSHRPVDELQLDFKVGCKFLDGQN